MKPIKTALSISIYLSLTMIFLLPHSLFAEEITLSIEATITEVIDDSSVFGGSVSKGDHIMGEYTFDTNTANTSDKPNAGHYRHSILPSGVRLTINGITMETDYGVSNSNGFTIFISNNFNNTSIDRYLFQSYENKTSLQNALVEYILLELRDNTGTAIDSIDLTPPPSDLSNWNENSLVIALCTEFVDPCSGEFAKITSEIDSLVIAAPTLPRKEDICQTMDVDPYVLDDVIFSPIFEGKFLDRVKIDCSYKIDPSRDNPKNNLLTFRVYCPAEYKMVTPTYQFIVGATTADVPTVVRYSAVTSDGKLPGTNGREWMEIGVKPPRDFGHVHQLYAGALCEIIER